MNVAEHDDFERSIERVGASVVCAARRTHEIERVAEEIIAAGGKAIACTTDVTDEAAVNALAEKAVSEYGGLQMWVNNAGGSPVGWRRCR